MNRRPYALPLTLLLVLPLVAPASRAQSRPAAPPAAQATPTPEATGWHTVRPGETLRGIAAQFLGSQDRWVEIHRLNPGIADPDRIAPGLRIRIPSALSSFPAARLSQLDGIYAARGQSVRNDTAGPGETYARSLVMTPGQINEALEQIKVDGLKALNDGLVDAIVNFRSLGDVASNVIRSIAAQLVQLAVSKYITGPLAGLLGLGAGGGATGGGSGGLGQALGLAASVLGGRANGGPVNAQRPYLVGERGVPELFVPDVGGRIMPFTRPVAAMAPANDRGGPVQIHFHGQVNERQARISGAQAARAYREEQARHMRVGG